MSKYTPSLAPGPGTKFQRLAKAILEDIRSGKLAPGFRLPPHRGLAHAVGVTPGTVSRAYGELAAQGLVSGEVGRGSYVIDPSAPAAIVKVQADSAEDELIDFAVNRPPSGILARELAATFAALAREPVSALMAYQPDAGMPHQREACAAWLRQFGIEVPGSQIVLSAGAQHATAAILMALARPGDTVIVEEFTYTGFKALASELRLKLEPVATDAYGLLPSDVERHAKAAHAKWLYCMPGINNPTTATMPRDRRAELARIARNCDLRIIEDGTYDFCVDRPAPPLAMQLPERCFYVTSLSKSLAPGLRAGIVAVPADAVSKVAASIRNTMWMAPPLGLEIAARWMRDGTADRLIGAQRVEYAARQSLAKKVLRGASFATQPASAFLWLTLPAGWHSADFVAAARGRGVRVAPTDAFAVRRHAGDGHLRLGLASTRSRDDVKTGLERIAALLAEPPRAVLEYV